VAGEKIVELNSSVAAVEVVAAPPKAKAAAVVPAPPKFDLAVAIETTVSNLNHHIVLCCCIRSWNYHQKLKQMFEFLLLLNPLLAVFKFPPAVQVFHHILLLQLY
jgi:hypothetical protein